MENASKLFKQRLQRIHVSVGISASLFMYLCVFFGIFAIFLPYIQTWEKPSRHFEAANIKEINYSKMIDPVISDPNFPTNNIIIELPGYFNDPALKVNHMFVEPVVFNPKTMEKVNDEGDNSQLARFLNHMHYGRPFMSVGYFVFGLVAVSVMLLIIGGLIQVYYLKYNNNPKNHQGKFSKYHRKVFMWLFAPFVIVTLTGAYMNIGYSGSTLMTYISSKGEISNTWQAVGPVLKPQRALVEKNNEQASMLPISELIQKAEDVNPSINFDKIKLINWKDSSAQVELTGYNPNFPFLNGVFNNPVVVLSGVDGSLIEYKKVLDGNWTSMFADTLYFLHLLFGVDIFVRTIIAIIMAICGVAIGFGVMLFLEKKAKKFDNKIPFYHWFGKLSLTVMIGVIPATGFIFFLQWLLPFDMQDRMFWQKGLFFIAWLSTLTWSFYRICSFKAAKEFLVLGAILFMITPLVHFYVSGFSPIELFTNNMFIILNVDIALFIFGLLLLFIGFKIPKDREEFKLLFSKKKDK